MNRWDIITEFIKKHKYKDYLEIGYYKGWSFDNVIYRNDWLNMTAVDPNPCKNKDQEQMKYGEAEEYERDYYDGPTRWLIKKTSDDFFGEYDKQIEYVKANHNSDVDPSCFDIIFIDGLHEAAQVEKDIHNSLRYLKPGGTIILHDCNPPKYEHTTTGIDGCWTGDAYKAWVKFRYEHPEYITYTIDTDWGVGVIETPYEIYGNDGIGKSTRILDWQVFDKDRKELLNLISVEEFKTKLNEGRVEGDTK